MGNCLVTKLKGSVDNDSLKKIGEVKIHFNQVTTPTADTHSIQIKAVYDNLTLRVTNGHFTDSTFTQDYGTTYTVAVWATDTVYISNTGADLFIPNKYGNLGQIHSGGSGWYRDNIILDIEDLTYTRYLGSLYVRGCDVIGDIGKFKPGPEFGLLEMTNCRNIKGSLDEFFNNIDGHCSINTHGHLTLNMDNLQKVTVKGTYLHESEKVSGSLNNLVAHTYRSEDHHDFPLSLCLASKDGSGVTGNILVLKDYFDVNPQTPGDNLSCYLINCPNVSGTLESLADALVTMGKTAGVLNFRLHPQSSVTIGGEAPIEGHTYVVTFTQSGYTIA